MTQPNFLVIVADQLRADAVGAFGSTIAKTPEIDKLAARGTIFRNAFVQNSVCAPSRASFLTGWYPHTRGHRTLFHLLRPSDPNLLRTLKESGYHVTHVGERGDTFAPGAAEVSCTEYGFGVPPDVVPFHRGKLQPGAPMARLFYSGCVPGDDAGLDGDEAATRTVERWLEAPPDQPWMLYVPLFAPHCPFGVSEPWFSMHGRDAMPDPVAHPDGTEPKYMAAIRAAYGIETITPAQWREVIGTYHGMTSRLDWQVGRMLEALRRSGKDRDTVVVFFSDHGEYLGDYGLIEKWPTGLHECLMRTPLIVAGPGLPGGERRDGMVEMVDLAPTLFELAGIKPQYTHFGRSLVPSLHDAAAPHRQFAFADCGYTLAEEPLMEHAAFPYDLKANLQHEVPLLVGKAVSVRDQDWSYVWRLYEPAELYDRRVDRSELHNVAGRPENQAVEAMFRDAILRWMVETADVLPWQQDPRKPPIDLPKPAAATAP